MKQLNALDGLCIVVALASIIMPFFFSYGIKSMILGFTMGISLLSGIFVTNKKVRIFITVACLSAIFYSYFQIN